MISIFILASFLVLTHSFPFFSFDNPENRNIWFSNVFKGIKREHWERMNNILDLLNANTAMVISEFMCIWLCFLVVLEKTLKNKDAE